MTHDMKSDTPVYSVITAFAETMLEPMIKRYSLYPAKGTTKEQFAHNSDQMMLTHILNGLFATLKLVYEAQQRNLLTLSQLYIDDLKLYVLGYTLHDLDKILGDGQPFHTRTTLATQDAYRKIAAELEHLNASAFFPQVADWIPEITWLAVNTQRSRNINLSHFGFIPDDEVFGEEVVARFQWKQSPERMYWSKTEKTLRNLCTLSDLLAYFIKTPDDALLSQAATRETNGIMPI